MKKFFGWLFSILGYLFVVVGLAVPLLGIMQSVTGQTGAVWLKTVYDNAWLGLGVTIGVVALVVLIGSIINAHTKKAGYVLSPVLGLGAYGAMLYLANFGMFKEALGSTHILSVIGLNSLANATLIYIAGGAVVLGLILGIVGKVLRRKACAAKAKTQREQQMEAHDAYVPTSRDTDLAMASSRTPKIERYVRDPWGNLIKEEEYNERIRASKDKKF